MFTVLFLVIAACSTPKLQGFKEPKMIEVSITTFYKDLDETDPAVLETIDEFVRQMNLLDVSFLSYLQISRLSNDRAMQLIAINPAADDNSNIDK